MKSRGSDSFLMLCQLDRRSDNDWEGGNIGWAVDRLIPVGLIESHNSGLSSSIYPLNKFNPVSIVDGLGCFVIVKKRSKFLV